MRRIAKLCALVILCFGLTAPVHPDDARATNCAELQQLLRRTNQEQQKLEKNITRNRIEDTIVLYKFLGLQMLKEQALAIQKENCIQAEEQNGRMGEEYSKSPQDTQNHPNVSGPSPAD